MTIQRNILMTQSKIYQATAVRHIFFDEEKQRESLSISTVKEQFQRLTNAKLREGRIFIEPYFKDIVKDSGHLIH